LLFCLSVAVAPIAIASGGTTACGVPDSFNNLVGGPVEAGNDGPLEATVPIELRPDPSLRAPRPLSPISVSWVNGTKARFKWALEPNTIGARVEVCQSRACDRGEKKTFDGGGSEVLSPELTPGIWFWRLYSKTAETIGTTPSVTWEILIRGGPQQDGHAGGSVTDINGDGVADLLVTFRSTTNQDGGVFTESYPFLGVPGSDGTELDMNLNGFQYGPPISSSLTDAEMGVIDVNGDGFPDLISNDDFNNSNFAIGVYPGEPKGLNTALGGRINLQPFTELPSVREVGDFEGDGYGDVFVGTKKDVLIVRGSAKYLGAAEFLLKLGGFVGQDAEPYPAPPTSLRFSGGAQRNGDSYGDVAVFWPLPPEPPDFLRTNIVMFTGGPPGIGQLQLVPMGDFTGARSFTNGDLDGDGLTDTVFVTTSASGKTSVCALLSGKPKLAPLQCWSPDPTPSTGFASSLACGDLDADGRDEILVGSTDNGFDVLRLNVEAGGFTPTHQASEFGAYLTTIFPGRPGPAIWAATQASNAQIAVFKGTERKALLQPPMGTTFGPLIR